MQNQSGSSSFYSTNPLNPFGISKVPFTPTNTKTNKTTNESLPNSASVSAKKEETSIDPMCELHKHINGSHSKSEEAPHRFQHNSNIKVISPGLSTSQDEFFKKPDGSGFSVDEYLQIDRLSASSRELDPNSSFITRVHSLGQENFKKPAQNFGLGRKVNGRYEKYRPGNLSGSRVLKILTEERVTNSDWGVLQKNLSNEYNIIHHESQVRKDLLGKIEEKYQDYFEKLTEMKTLESKLQAIRQNKGFKLIGNKWQKILIKDSSFLDDAQPLIREFLYLLNENPEILATIFTKKGSKASKELVDTLIQGFFENLVENDPFDSDLLRFITLILRIEVGKCEKIEEICQSNAISMVLDAYFNRPECKQFIKTVMEPVCLKIIRLSEQIELDRAKLQAIVNEKANGKGSQGTMPQKTPRKSIVSSKNTIKRPSTVEQQSSSNENDPFYLEVFRNYIYKKASAKMKENPERKQESPFQLDRKQEILFQMDKMNEILSKDRDIEETSIENNGVGSKIQETGRKDALMQSMESISPKRRMRNQTEIHDFMLEISEKDVTMDPEVQRILASNTEKVKKYCTMFLDSFFDRLDQIPTGIRLLLKVFLGVVEEKFPNLENPLKDMADFLLKVWLHPVFTDPINTNIVKSDEYELNETQKGSIQTFKMVLTRLFKEELFSEEKDSFIASQLNGFIKEQRCNFLTIMELIVEIDDGLVSKDRAINGSGETTVESPPSMKNGGSKMKSQCICLSLENIKQLLVLVKEAGDSQIDEKYPRLSELVKQVCKIYANENELLTSYKIRSLTIGGPDQVYLLFTQTFLDKTLEIDYEDEFAKIQGSKSSDKKNLTDKLRSLFKLVLISIDDLPRLLLLTRRASSPNLLDLIKTQSRIHRGTEQNIKYSFYQKEKVNLQLALQFLKKNLANSSDYNPEDNFRSFYFDLIREYNERTEHMGSVIHEAKSSLLNGLQVLDKNISFLDASLNQLRKLEKHLVITRFVKEHEIKFCITTEAERKEISKSFSLSEPAKIGKGIQLIDLDCYHSEKCIHEQVDLYVKMYTGFGGGPRRNTAKNLSLESEKNRHHIHKVIDFIERFGSFQELKEIIQSDRDCTHEKDIYQTYFDNMLFEFEKWMKQNMCVCFSDLKESDYNEYIYTLEKYVTRLLYDRIFPKAPTLRDLAACARLKVLDWITFDDLIDNNSKGYEERGLSYMIKLAATKLLEMDEAVAPREKLEKAIQLSNYSAGAYALIENKNVSADESLPLTIRVFLKAKPNRVISNLNYVNLLFRQVNSNLGYAFKQSEVAFRFLNEIKPKDIRMTKKEFESKVYEKERKEQVYFFRRRPRAKVRFITDVNKGSLS